jgi:carbon-monoxide dehydrogenase small subunit
VKVELILNGRPTTLEARSDEMLAEALELRETCAIGVCGACTVLLDGRMVSSCIALAVFADGHEVTTVEGLAGDERLHPVQQAFMDCGGFQCGICTPGQVVAAKALLDTIENPTEAQIKEWMLGNLCRCTGYYKIVESIQAAAKAVEP